MRPILDARSAIPLLALALVLLSAPGCGPADQGVEEAPPPGPRAENPELGIAFAQVPGGFEVETNEAADLVLTRSAPDESGTLRVLVGPVRDAGVNLVDQVWQEKERVESLPGGDYLGQNELAGADIGTVFTSRGRFLGEDGEAVEEYRALAVHPGANRLLILDYEYPPGEGSGDRLRHLMEAIEQVEAIGPGGPEETASAD